MGKGGSAAAAPRRGAESGLSAMFPTEPTDGRTAKLYVRVILSIASANCAHFYSICSIFSCVQPAASARKPWVCVSVYVCRDGSPASQSTPRRAQGGRSPPYLSTDGAGRAVRIRIPPRLVGANLMEYPKQVCRFPGSRCWLGR